MSLKTWKKEFFTPISHTICKKMTWEKCIDHSILKWTGLLNKNLSKHCLYKTYGGIKDNTGDNMQIGSSNCALCLKHSMNEDELVNGDISCNRCPIWKITKSNCFAQYGIFCGQMDPNPMIRLLEKTLKLWREK